MSIQDLRIYAVNFLAFTLSFSSLETILRMFLLVVSIVYTILKLIGLKNGKKDD